MALFAAYAEQAINSEPESNTGAPENQDEWLNNSSFQSSLIAVSIKDVPLPSSDPVVSSTSTVKRAKVKTKEQKVFKDDGVEGVFKIDKTSNKEFLKVLTISRPSAPKYKVCFKFFNIHKHKKRNVKRYYDIDKKFVEDIEHNAKLTQKDLDKPIEKFENFVGIKEEQDISRATAFYNRTLTENPNDIDTWLKYVRLQDAIFQFEKSFRKGSFGKGVRVTAERKLAILDKALTHNPECETLMRERLHVAVGAYPADELQAQLKKLVEKEPENIIWWQGYIEATQCSMSHCNIPATVQLYTKCLSTLHQLRRNSTLEKARLEENILRMLYHCGLFLKQSGLFELLWTLLRLYLELNLAPSDKSKFNIGAHVDDKQLVELEEVVLRSQLPIHELWLRIERLREACHWLPLVGNDVCEDPQRLIFPEDVAELIHPITTPGNTIKLTATILTLLKTPLLPCRHTTMQSLGLDYVPWGVDSVETILSLFLPLYPIDLTNKNLLKDTQRLSVGPQYLKTFPGQEEYLDFLLKTIKNCTDCLCDKDKMAITVWWFRYQRLLIVLDKQDRFNMSSTFKKKIKNSIKQLLKTDEHRNTVIFYQEYALIEYELGNFDTAVNILTTAITMFANGKSMLNLVSDTEFSLICSLYRTLVELHLNASTDLDRNRQKALKYLIMLILGKQVDISTETVNEIRLKFKHVTLKLLNEDMTALMLVDHFLPNFYTDWIICNGWFIYLTEGGLECGKFIEEILSGMEPSTLQKEILYEFYTAILFKHCLERPGVGLFKLLDDVLHRAITNFPNNIFFLSVLAKEQSINCSLGQPWWKITSLLVNTGHAIPSLFLILIANQRTCEMEENWCDTITGKAMSEDNGLINRMVSLFRRLTSSDVCTRRCGLIWRLYLQFLHAHFDPSILRKAYYRAVEECPWLKALYIDAAIYIPAELAQIQDLLIEKQLRLHVTPEELDVLRN